MEELRKIVRVMQKVDPSAPHEVMLVLDAGTAQNGLAQARHFGEAVGVSGIALTKLDGTAKGGIVFAVARELGCPSATSASARAPRTCASSRRRSSSRRCSTTPGAAEGGVAGRNFRLFSTLKRRV